MAGHPTYPTAGRQYVSTGFTLVEFLVVTTMIVVVSAIALPAFSAYYEKGCIMAAVSEITGMIREAKQRALAQEQCFALGFNPASGRVSLISGRGHDGKWNTDDDVLVRSFRLTDKGGGLRFGYGGCGPVPGLAADKDGVTFQSNNTLVCNPDLTGSAGAVYLITRSGTAMAIVMNSTDFGYKLWRWNGKKWERL